MSDLVKTEEEIYLEYPTSNTNRKVLVFPSGLDRLEEMLNEEFEKEMEETKWNTSLSLSHVISSVFARFKKEKGIKEKSK